MSDPGLAPNPKEAMGVRKPPQSTLPWPPLFEVGKRLSGGTVPALAALDPAVLYRAAVGMAEGAYKYARHNYRVAGRIKASVYFDATCRHLDALLMGEDIDPESGQYHGVKAFTSLLVLRDSQFCGTYDDDRPPASRYLFVDKFKGKDDTFSTYYGQARRALASWWEGGSDEEITNALVSLHELCSAYINEALDDDRGLRQVMDPEFLATVQADLDDLNEKFPADQRKAPWTQKRVDEVRARGTLEG